MQILNTETNLIESWNLQGWIRRHGHPDFFRPAKLTAFAPPMEVHHQRTLSATESCDKSETISIEKETQQQQCLHSLWLKNELHRIKKVSTKI